ncbi:MAG: FlgD immunoglobulin-like domain containing protein [Candidatus Cloacimonadaceae bacterium]|jgi:hypothetical protein|nr:T9SS type A sorting domain-containing protein [Candidatus Cloacimonadota bacterium]
MCKRLLTLLVFGLFTVMAFGAGISLITASLSTDDSSPQLARPGDTITVTYNFTLSEFDEIEGLIQGASLGSTNLNKIRIYWYSGQNGTGSSTTTDVTTNTFVDQTVVNGVHITRSLTFVLPEPPTGMNSFKVRTQIYGDDGMFNTVLSSIVYSTGDYGYITLDTNTAPTATVSLVNPPDVPRVGQTLTGNYGYYDADNDLEDTGSTTIQWMRSTEANPSGYYVAIVGANSLSYTITDDDLGRFLKLRVIPFALTGVLQGEPAFSPATNQIMQGSTISIDASTNLLNENGNNDGSLAGEIIVNISNGQFKSSVSGITVSNLPTGLAVGSITRVSTTQIRFGISGNAVYHEHNASILNTGTLRVTIPADQMEGQTNALTTPTGFMIDFTNNPIKNFACESVGNNRVTLTWDAPNGLQPTSRLDAFIIYRNSSLLTQVDYSAGKGAYSYTDTAALNGSSYSYYVVADYDNTVIEDPQSINVGATPMGFSSFAFTALSVTGVIDHDVRTIDLLVPYDTNLTNLVATFAVPTSITVKIGSNTQSSGVTVNNFSTPLSYVLSASDGSSSTYVVTVTLDEEPIAAPVMLAATTTVTTIRLIWNAVDGATGYSLDMSTSDTFSSFVTGYENKAIDASVTSHLITGLTEDTAYYVRMRSKDADNEYGEYSATQQVSTEQTGSGTGSIEINTSDPVAVTLGALGAVNPALTIDPASFTSGTNDVVNVTVSIGTAPEGLRYLLEFDNQSIGVGTFTMSYAGLGYDPTDIGYRINGGSLISLGAGGINTSAKTFTITIDAMKNNGKAGYSLEMITNDISGQTLPVVLSSFSATVVSDSKVRINWTTQSETGVQGFYVLRSLENNLDQAEMVSPLIDATNTSTTTSYVYTDISIPQPGEYYYWLQIQDIDGVSTYTNSIKVAIAISEEPTPEVILVTTLKNAYPNPFNPSITIAYEIAEAGPVSLEIYNTKGQKIRTLVSETKASASYKAVWDGKDASGRSVATGSYLLKMRAPGFDTMRKITLMK